MAVDVRKTSHRALDTKLMPALRAVYLVLLIVGSATFGAGVAHDDQTLARTGFGFAVVSIAIGLLARGLDRPGKPGTDHVFLAGSCYPAARRKRRLSPVLL